MRINFPLGIFDALGLCSVRLPDGQSVTMMNGDTLHLEYSLTIDGPEGVLKMRVAGEKKRPLNRKLLLLL